MKTRTLIFGNGVVHKKFLREIRRSDYLIGVDRGALWLLNHGVTPHLAIGDFDSVNKKEFRIIQKHVKTIKKYSKKKDRTDLELALKHARGETVIFGWSGKRFDHALATMHMLGSHTLVDEHNRIRMVGIGKTIVERASYRYISILPYTKRTTLSLTGFVYNLKKTTLKQGTSLGVSNEITGKRATITIFSGKAWIIESND